MQTLSFATDTDQLEASLTAIAEAAIDSVLKLAREDMVRRYGEIDAEISKILKIQLDNCVDLEKCEKMSLLSLS